MVSTLFISLWLALLSSRVKCQLEVTVSPDITVCETDLLPPTFTLMCSAGVTPVALVWEVTGLSTVGLRTIASGSTRGPFTYPSSSSIEEATLMVNDLDNSEIVNGTCFQCRHVTGSNGNSTATCVDVMRLPPCVSVVQVQTRTCSSITYTWIRPSSGLQYSTRVCPEDSPLCSNLINCTDCMSLTATGLSPNTNYTITVVSASSGGCVSQGCSSNVAVASTQSFTLPTPGMTADTVGVGTFAGATSTLSLLLVLSNIATGVITFLSSRRCYNKKNNPPPPNEKSVYYETVQSDSVQMQPSPAYQSVEQVK